MSKAVTFNAGALTAAHHGYAYQDLLTAYLLVQGLVVGFEQIVIDRKVVDDDRFDDVETCIASRRLRRQIKSSRSAKRHLTFSDFNDMRSSLRFDRLVRTFVSEGLDLADEYRLCATWSRPELGEPLMNLLSPTSVPLTFEGFATTVMRLDGAKVWPQDGNLIFPNAFKELVAAGDIGRDDVVRFCDRFIIEVGLPQASLDLFSPGPLERLVLDVLQEGVGIGRYPNDWRRVEDVAALAIHVAMTARAAGDVLTKAELIRRLDIRTDFGRVAQAFPLERRVMQERTHVRQNLANAIQAGGVHLLLAGPGSGKSWVLTQLAEEMHAEGHIVARHYCFLEPGDELVERRVTTDVFIGNLMAELADALRLHGIKTDQTYAAGLDELEALLKKATSGGRHVVIIVDGLDHIARVVAGATSLSDSETDIVERLAALTLPGGVSLVIGSQPGHHLDSIRAAHGQAVEHSLEAWTSEEIRGLATALGVSAALDNVGLLDGAQRDAIFTKLSDKSEGNPLYARYLSRALVNGLHTGDIVSPAEWLRSAPAIDGDISRYYQHLYDSASKQGQAIADVLGVLDFAVTVEEVQEIVGSLLEDRVADAVVTLSPVLSQASAQGGVRIFHESFRRFMMEKVQKRGASLEKILKPVVLWLESNDFFLNAKSYRFLLPVLRRSGREANILQRVGKDFVKRSVEYGHPNDAIERNLTLAADVAARSLDWPSLMRIAELARSLEACFSEGNNNWHEFWETHAQIFGPQATADRLLFDGRPTLGKDEGLVVCAAVDSAGVAAPWREYLSLASPDAGVSYTPNFDYLGEMTQDEEIYLAALYGRLRLGQHFRVRRSLLANLSDLEEKITSNFVRKVACMLVENGFAWVVRLLVRRATASYCGHFALSPPVACALLLGLADASSSAVDFCGPELPYASLALEYATTLDEVLWCVDRGASLHEALKKLGKKSDLELFRSAATQQSNFSSMRAWAAMVRLTARTEEGRAEIDDTLRMAQGEGWYLCWVRYVLRLAIVEGLSLDGAPFDVISAFKELVADTRPFVGKPRACDLYSLEGLINESLKRGLSLLRSADEWQQAVEIISEARDRTATHLDREDGGPITVGVFISLLLPYAANTVAAKTITTALEKRLADEEASGTYYSTHAEFRMRLARWHVSAGAVDTALEHWDKAAEFLVAYTFHKDIALFDLLDSVSALKEAPGQAALKGLARLQPLVGAALRHTDRRETKNTPNAWFSALLEVDEVRAASTLAHTLAGDVGSPSWIGLKALRKLLRKVSSHGEPLIVDLLWETLLFEIEYEGEGRAMVEERFVVLERMAQSNSEFFAERFARVSRQAQNDARDHSGLTVAPLRAFAKKHGLPFELSPRPERLKTTTSETGNHFPTDDKALRTGARPAFPVLATMVDIVATVRRLSKEQVGELEMYGLLTLPLSYMLSQMVERGEEAQAQRIIYFLVHDAKGWHYAAPHPICHLAKCLDAAGHSRLAAVAYVLEFTTAGGRLGWLNFGGPEAAPALHRALELDREGALQALANETARVLRLGGFNGVSRHLVQQIALWGDEQLAAAAWEEAFQVMEARLPLGDYAGYFSRLNLSEHIDWNLDEALVVLLLARINDPSIPRRISAMEGFARLIAQRVDVLPRPVRWFLTYSATVITVQTVLQVLLESTHDVSSIISYNRDILHAYAQSQSWALSTLAKALLSKIGMEVNSIENAFLAEKATASHNAQMLTHIGDRGGLLLRLARLWPHLPDMVATEVDRVTKNDTRFKVLLRERHYLEYDRLGRARPTAEVLSWPSELVAAVLDKALCGLPAHLWRTGQRTYGLENDILWALLPELDTRIALHSSLGARPAIPFPTEAERNVRALTRVPQVDVKYGGWIRLASREVHFFHSEEKHWDAPNRRAESLAGVVLTALDGTVPPMVGPFGTSDMSPWREAVDEDEALADEHLPQLVKTFVTKDWFGLCVALVPPLALRYRAKLHVSPFGTPLAWFDSQGNPAVILRTWRLRGNGHEVESYSTEGCDLLLRPDLEETLFRTFGGPLKELHQVSVTDVSSAN